MGYTVQNIKYIHYPPDDRVIGNAQCGGLCHSMKSEDMELGYLL